MNLDQIAIKAERLQSLIDQLSPQDIEVKHLGQGMTPLIDAALKREITQPMDWGDIPGRWLFDEAGLSQYRELEEAYADFKIELIGGDPPALKRFRAAVQAEEAKKSGS
jgi:hypothetical protein